MKKARHTMEVKIVNDLVKLQYKIIFFDVIILLVLILLSIFFSSEPMPWIKGYIFGGLIGILNFLLLGNTMYKASMMHPAKARVYAGTNYYIRLLITALVIIIALKADYLNAISVVIGLLLIKQIIFFSQVFSDKDFFKNIIKRKEDK